MQMDVRSFMEHLWNTICTFTFFRKDKSSVKVESWEQQWRLHVEVMLVCVIVVNIYFDTWLK